MGRFHSAREAKEFLISRIVEEAMRENVPLSEIERKMLYFSETDWTLPDITDVSDQFDREYDQDEYEAKITRLVSKAAKHDRKESGEQYDAWWDAIKLLEKQDHYILVMIRAAGLRPRFDQLKLFAAGVLVAAFSCLLSSSAISFPRNMGLMLGNMCRREMPFGSMYGYLRCAWLDFMGY
jgi:hypothetical protein